MHLDEMHALLELVQADMIPIDFSQTLRSINLIQDKTSSSFTAALFC